MKLMTHLKRINLKDVIYDSCVGGFFILLSNTAKDEESDSLFTQIAKPLLLATAAIATTVPLIQRYRKKGTLPNTLPTPLVLAPAEDSINSLGDLTTPPTPSSAESINDLQQFSDDHVFFPLPSSTPIARSRNTPSRLQLVLNISQLLTIAYSAIVETFAASKSEYPTLFTVMLGSWAITFALDTIDTFAIQKREFRTPFHHPGILLAGILRVFILTGTSLSAVISMIEGAKENNETLAPAASLRAVGVFSILNAAADAAPALCYCKPNQLPSLT